MADNPADILLAISDYLEEHGQQPLAEQLRQLKPMVETGQRVNEQVDQLRQGMADRLSPNQEAMYRQEEVSIEALNITWQEDKEFDALACPLFGHAVQELDPYLYEKVHVRPVTPEPLPVLNPGVPFYDATLAWIAYNWGDYDSMPYEIRQAWFYLLRISRNQHWAGEKEKRLALKNWERELRYWGARRWKDK